MIKTQRLITALVIVFLFLSCKSDKSDRPNDSKVFDRSKISDSTALSWYDLSDASASVVKLPDEVKEVSGITGTPDGRFFCHGDEDADVFEIDPKTGKILKTFFVGNTTLGTSVRGDFEDIAFVNDKFYLLESKGHIIEFKEGNPGEHVEYQTYKTKLTAANDCEGLCYDPATNSLLIACKGAPGERYEKGRAVYAFSLESKTLDEKARFFIPLDQLREKEFSPSGIARNPDLGSFFIISARGNAIIEISKDGRILNQRDLSREINRQPEGITFDNQKNLIITNEGGPGRPRLVSYPMRK